MYMTKKTIRQWRRGIGIPAVALILCAALFVGCSRDDGQEPDGGDPVALSFTAAVDGVAFAQGGTSAGLRGTSDAFTTRTTAGGDEWVQDDKVGIFMLDAGRNLPGITGAENRKFKVSDITTGALTLDDGGAEIYYPQSGNVDFIAYYPYGTTGTGAGEITADYKYNVCVVDQSDPAVIDILYAKKTDVAKSKAAVNLEFSHAMSKITLNVKAGNGLTSADISGLAASTIAFGGMPVTAELALQDGTPTTGTNLARTFSPLKAETVSATYDATFSAILVPQAADTYNGRTVVFTVGGQSYTWAIPAAEKFEAGNHYVYPLTVQKSGIVVAGSPTIIDWTVNDNDTGTAIKLPEMVLIPKGTFLMGSSDGSNPDNTNNSGLNTTPAEPNRGTNETQHKVTLTKDFYITKYAITNSQYVEFLNAKGIQGEMLKHSYIPGAGGNMIGGEYNGEHLVYEGNTHQWGVKWNTDKWIPQPGYEDHPVVWVTWSGAKAYAEWAGGSLPTEAQWEYACRGDKGSLPFGVGDGYKLDNTLANFDWKYSWSWDGSSPTADITDNGTCPGVTQAVGSYSPNSYGLYDMHGNVLEWCLDNSDGVPADYGGASVTDPTGPTTGYGRVLRGGYYGYDAQYCRSAYRFNSIPDYASRIFGFRVVVVP